MRKGRAQRKSRNPRSSAPKASQRLEKAAAQIQASQGGGAAAPSSRDVAEIAEETVQAEPTPRLAEAVAAVVPALLDNADAEKPEDAKLADEPTSLEPMVKAVEPEAKAAEVAGSDEISIPPAGDLAIDEHDEKFFSEGDLAHHVHASGSVAHDDDDWDHDKPSSRKHQPHVVRRRERFARYVKLAVAGASVVCLAAIGRSAMTTTKAPAPAPVAAVAVKEAAPVAEPVKAPEPAQPAPVAQPVKAEEKPAEPAAAATPKAEEKPAEPDTKVDAKAEKTASRRALESGKLDAAIAAGERSVAADAEDGEAWLILGAAYQEKGKIGEARRCYTACLKQGKRGPIGECAAMLR